jgi:hypothetical protein
VVKNGVKTRPAQRIRNGRYILQIVT